MNITLKRFEQEMAEHCAPTLSGIKAASIFSLPATDKEAVEKIIAEYETLLNPKGIYFKVLSKDNAAVNILVYNKKLLIDKISQLNEKDKKQIASKLKSELGINGVITLIKLRKSLGQFAEHKLGKILESVDQKACEESQNVFMSQIAKGKTLMSIVNAA